MNLFTGKKYYSDNGVCSFHEFARELDEDYLRTQVNGGDCGGGAPSSSPSAQGSSGSSGGSGSGGGAGHGTGGTSSSGTTTTPQSPAVNPGAGETQNSGNQSNPGYTGGGGNYEPPKEVMSNPQAYAYWLSLQDKAMKEGDPGKYKDYNVLGDHGKKEPTFITNTMEAVRHYFDNDGSPVIISGRAFMDVINKNNKIFEERIISGKTELSKGNYTLDMTTKDYFIGKTRIDYSIETGIKTSTVTFTAFNGDGFWDANIFASKKTEDGPGPNNEFSGGTVYPFIPQSWSITFDNPSQMNWLSGQ